MDFKSVLASYERSFEGDLGLRLNLVSGAMYDPEFMAEIKDGIIVEAILCTGNILDMFTVVEGSLQGSGEACRLTLKMQGSGRLVDIPIRRDDKSGYDVTAVIAALEQSYREVLFMGSGEVILSAAQRQVMRAKAPAWLDGLLAAEGVASPEVIVDTENVAWEGSGLKMKITVSAKEGKTGAGKEYVLTIPLIEGGQGDYSVIEPLAKKITTDWLKENACLCSEALYQAVYEPMQELAPAYVQWVIAETQKDVQRFLDGFNAALEKKREELKKVEKELKELPGKLREEAGKVKKLPTFPPTSRPPKGIRERFAWEYTSRLDKIAHIFRWIASIPGSMDEQISEKGKGKEILKGLEFAFRCVWVIKLESTWSVLKDVARSYIGAKGPEILRKKVSSIKKGSKIYKFITPVIKSARKTGSSWYVAEFFLSRLVKFPMCLISRVVF